jgi:DNA polymerase-3 subunit delta'
LSHALLFDGVSGIGKSTFVIEFARFILCEKREKSGIFCAQSTQPQCHSCRLVETKVHPNMYWVEPEKSGHAIKIDQIRDMIEFATQSAYMGKHQCIIINPAEQMNIFAANSLLKTLEEPAANVFLFLVTKERSRLPATIVSRAMHVQMLMPSKEVALNWLSAQSKKTIDEHTLALKIAVGAPLAALSLLQSEVSQQRELIYQTVQRIAQQGVSLVQSAFNLQDIDMPILLNFLLSWMIDAIKLKCGVEKALIENQDYAKPLTEFSSARSIRQLDQCLHHLINVRNEVVRGVHLNKTLSIENLLMHLVRNNYVSS